jgi:hypothetical protein
MQGAICQISPAGVSLYQHAKRGFFTNVQAGLRFLQPGSDPSVKSLPGYMLLNIQVIANFL